MGGVGEGALLLPLMSRCSQGSLARQSAIARGNLFREIHQDPDLQFPRKKRAITNMSPDKPGQNHVALLRARNLRTASTVPEQMLWEQLRAKKCGGFKFRRQAPIGNFISDFVCFDIKLVIELDGPSHDNAQAYDLARTQWLQKEGFMVIRFTNRDVMSKLEGVWEEIRRICDQRAAELGR